MSSEQVSPPKSAIDVPGTPPRTIMTKEYVAMVGRLAYVWGWPLVNNRNRAEAVKGLPEPGRLGDIVPASPPGYIAMLTDYIKAEERFVTCPNQDTVWRRIPAPRQHASCRAGAGFRRTILHVSDRRSSHGFFCVDRQAIRHQARVLFAGGLRPKRRFLNNRTWRRRSSCR
jgi:hypothetical protein